MRGWIIGFVIISIFWMTCFIFSYHYERKMIANILNIPELPESFVISECDTLAFIDVHTKCAVKVEPLDFPVLINGYSYKEYKIYQSSYEIGIKHKVGKEFIAESKYIVRKKFVDSDHRINKIVEMPSEVIVAVDAQKKHLIVYIFDE